MHGRERSVYSGSAEDGRRRFWSGGNNNSAGRGTFHRQHQRNSSGRNFVLPSSISPDRMGARPPAFNSHRPKSSDGRGNGFGGGRGGRSAEFSERTHPSDIPGFVWNPHTRRYFKILPDHSPIGTTAARLREAAAEKERVQALSKPVGHGFGLNGGRGRARKSVVDLMWNRSMGLGLCSGSMKRNLLEQRVGGMSERPPAVLNVSSEHPDEAVDLCYFLDSSGDGKSLLGAWKRKNRPWCRIMCLGMEVDKGKVSETDYGLRVTAPTNWISALEPTITDFCKAPVDSSVTCVLFVTMPVVPNQGSRVLFHPILELSFMDDMDFLQSPVYNIDWKMNRDVTACAWNGKQMRLGLGMSEYSLIVDVIAEANFRLSSRHKRVLTQTFSKDGNLLFMGLCGGETLCCDLRLPAHHTVYSLPQQSSHWLRLLEDNNRLVASDFQGNVKLWDLRKKDTVVDFVGHKNSFSKLPCVIDDTESLIFAVGEDGTTRGWSLRNGRRLCSVPSPVPVRDRSWIPRLAYSNSWGGLSGNSGLVLGVGPTLYSYQLPLSGL